MKIDTRRYFDVEVSRNLDERYAHKDGTHPVTILVYHRGKYWHYPTKLRLVKWEDIEPREDTAIRKMQDDVYNVVKDLYDEGKFSIEAVKGVFKKPRQHTINKMMRDEIDIMLENKQVSTAGHYMSSLKKFEKVFGEVAFDKIVPSMFIKFRDMLIKDGYSKSTVIIYLSDFKRIINKAIALKMMDPKKFPFKQHKYDIFNCEIPTGPNKRTEWFLDMENIQKIIDYQKEHNDEYIGAFLFTYFANGMNLADALRLKYDSHYYASGEKEFMFIRKKTQAVSEMKIRIPILDIMRTFLKTTPSEGEYVFDVIKEGMTFEQERLAATNYAHRIANHLKKMCKELGFKKIVTPTFARHSFATNMRRMAVPQEYIDYAMGHCKGLSQNYFGGYPYTISIEYNSRLLKNVEKSEPQESSNQLKDIA